MKLSALVLVKNEEDIIEECLKQLDFADEIIVLDQNSKDSTAKIARKYTDKVFFSKSENFSKNRNILAEHTKGEWLLYLDADEKLTSDLISEIKKTIINPKHQAYYFARKNFILGHEMKHGGWWPDYAPRLFKKDTFIKWTGKVHESPQVKGDFGYLENPLIHKTARSVRKMFDKSIKWAKVEAELRFSANQSKVSIPKIIKASFFEFIRRYFIKKAVLDGVIGLVESIYQALHTVMVLTYLWELQNKTKEKYKEADK